MASPLKVVQEQLDAYNDRDLERFLAVFSQDVKVVDYFSGKVIATSREELRPRYVDRFSKNPQLHCEVLGRLCMNNIVVDREIISGLADGTVADCLATYEVNGSLITNVQLAWQPRK
eukprot:TRINITY_DN4819_c0_g1_i1.p1 TRINITY_DN4819_c0_g1~~TRINITY_DN4819_c0_g1_i1.p1  ORF type:complete len:117 (+),score=15.90 TRINITY_DN4819_c0_g1_i1:33-383(+)